MRPKTVATIRKSLEQAQRKQRELLLADAARILQQYLDGDESPDDVHDWLKSYRALKGAK